MEQLTDLFSGHGYGAEPAGGFQLLCACCSEGTVERERAVHAGTQRVFLAAPEEEARRLPARWAAGGAGRGWRRSAEPRPPGGTALANGGN
ncbi:MULTISPECIES: hypothetical protein [Streptomyces]|uniref:Uncharacterized protein n=1 Tax=Streptomyces eurythermus TaxID=42237 RepID=A0ABW6Z6Z8_9ACTN|nr:MULTISPECIES: hypothetical protein [Streptomyces]QIS70852.1 hypothetical protein HB370_13245 [Streptomyces sp. DSM 40868]